MCMQGETVEGYMVALHSCMQDCVYGPVQEELLRECIVDCIRDFNLQRSKIEVR